ALHFAGDVSGEIDEGALRIREQLRRLGDGSLQRPRAATDPDFVGNPAVPEPRDAQRARPLRLGDPAALHHDRDIVAGTAAAEAGDVLDGAGGGRAHAILTRCASRERYTVRARAGSAGPPAGRL